MLQVPCSEVFSDIVDFQVKFVVRRGKFPEEDNVEVYAVSGSEKRLMIVKVFRGRPPYYRRWVEVFSIASEFSIDGRIFRFAGSVPEQRLIGCLSRLLGGGESIFIEYTYDTETRVALEVGVPPHLTRLGYILLLSGFTWFKDWYFPEGFMEGGPKLQAQKPVSEEAKTAQIADLCREAAIGFRKLELIMGDARLSSLASRAIERFNELVGRYCSR